MDWYFLFYNIHDNLLTNLFSLVHVVLFELKKFLCLDEFLFQMH